MFVSVLKALSLQLPIGFVLYLTTTESREAPAENFDNLHPRLLVNPQFQGLALVYFY